MHGILPLFMFIVSSLACQTFSLKIIASAALNITRSREIGIFDTKYLSQNMKFYFVIFIVVAAVVLFYFSRKPNGAMTLKEYYVCKGKCLESKYIPCMAVAHDPLSCATVLIRCMKKYGCTYKAPRSNYALRR